MTGKEITANRQDLTTLQGIIDVYQQIAAMRVRRLKNGVIQNREYYGGLSEVFKYVAYLHYNKKLKELSAEFKLTVKKTDQEIKEQTSLLVLLSSNTGLYGDIIRQTFESFYAETLKNPKADILITGAMGKNMYEEKEAHRDYKYIELEDGINDESINRDEVFEYISIYDNTLIFHSEFKTIIKQQVVVSTLSEPKPDEKDNELQLKYESFIFEPEVDTIYNFFKKQILSSIFGQVLFENSLSKFTSRMVITDTASSNLSGALKNNRLDELRFKHRKSNSKQLELMSGRSLWKQV